MSTKEKILGTLFSLFISFFLFVLLFVSVSKVMLMNKGYLLSTLDKTGYYGDVTDELTLDFKKSAGAAGFEPAIYDDFLKEAEVKKAAVEFINASFQDKNAVVKQTNFKEKLRTYLKDVIKNENLVLDKEGEQRLEKYIDINANGYRKYVQFPFIQYIVMGVDMMDRILLFVIGACSILLLFAIFFLYRMRLKKADTLSFLSTAASGAGWMIVLIPALILLGGYTHKIRLEPEYYYKFFLSFLDGYLWMLILCGTALIIVGGILLTIAYKKRLRAK